MSSAAEAELGALLFNAKTAIPIGKSLEELGHKQPLVLMQTVKLMAQGIVTTIVQPTATNPMDMWFHLLWDRKAQGQFWFCWRSGKDM